MPSSGDGEDGNSSCNLVFILEVSEAGYLLVTKAVHHTRREAEMQHDLHSSIIFLEILCEARELALKLREMHPRREANSKVRTLNFRHKNHIIDFESLSINVVLAYWFACC